MGCAALLYGMSSGVEVALLVSQRSRLMQWKDEGRRSAALALHMKEDPGAFLMTLQMGMTCTSLVVAVLAGVTMLSTVLPWSVTAWPFLTMIPWLQALALALLIGVLAYVLLVFGQMIPRAIVQRHPEQILCWFAGPVMTLTRLCGLLRAWITFSSTTVLWLCGQPRPPAFQLPPQMTEEEVTTIVREGAERGIFEEVEHELIAGVFEFTDTAAREIMVPRVRMQALDITTPAAEVVQEVVDIGHARIPVYEVDLDHIVGVLYLKDLLRVLGTGKTLELRSLLRPPVYIPETIQISRLLRMLQQQRSSMAIVVDEHGGVAGLVTMEDLIEQLVGDIRDEGEPETAALVMQLADGSLVIQGSAPLRELRERFALPVEESSEYQTLAGLLLSRLGQVPQGGETVVDHGYTFTVVDVDGPRITRVKVEQRFAADPQSAPLSPHQEAESA